MDKLIITSTLLIVSQIGFMPQASAWGPNEIVIKRVKCNKEAGSRTGQEKLDFVNKCSGSNKSSQPVPVNRTPQHIQDANKRALQQSFRNIEQKKKKPGNN
ncbi:MAG: hypothetical protein D4R74_00535 [Betaproteobacteria bacterium]|nr:MAG: hypothetical protein D4R74_00535 [Betaproteobacteria bacterium]